jgi:NADPH:quinone reductase-like Zn-dependent oxidoreductase
MRRCVAGRYGGPEVLTLARDAPIPKPRGNQLLIRVVASSVNPSAS